MPHNHSISNYPTSNDRQRAACGAAHRAWMTAHRAVDNGTPRPPCASAVRIGQIHTRHSRSCARPHRRRRRHRLYTDTSTMRHVSCHTLTGMSVHARNHRHITCNVINVLHDMRRFHNGHYATLYLTMALDSARLPTDNHGSRPPRSPPAGGGTPPSPPRPRTTQGPPPIHVAVTLATLASLTP